MQWLTFNPGGGYVTATTLFTSADPYLAWAEVKGFGGFVRPGSPTPQTVPVLVQLKTGHSPAQLQALLTAGGLGHIAGNYAAATTRYCVAELSAQALAAVGSAPLGHVVERWEFVMPALPGRPPRTRVPQAPPSGTITRQTPGPGDDNLLAVIDFGCPFAHAHFRNAGSTRVLNVWDQDSDAPAFGAAPAAGGTPPDFGYGREVNRSMLNALMAAATRPGTGTLDEDSVYEHASYPELRARATHGAHVLDQFAGPLTQGDRVYKLPDQPPDFVPKLRPSSRADIVFVQLPRDAWADPAGNALARCVLDGIRYVLSCKGPNTKQVVVNVSTAIYTGPHNGTSILELALAELVTTEAAAGCALEICMPTGNSRDARWHAEGRILAGQRAHVRIRVPPGSEAPTFVQVWCEGDATIDVSGPGVAGSTGPMAASQAKVLHTGAVPVACAIHTRSPARGTPSTIGTSASGSWLALMIEPTETLDRAGTQAPYGDWIVDIAASTSKDVDARVEVARNEPDLGTPVRGRPARLVDPAYVPAGVADPDPDDPAAAAGIVSGILPTRRRNTISGVVTGPGTIAIAGLTLRPQLEPSPYASAGPAPGAASPAAGARRSPDASAICDESRALPGIRGAGTRSGVVVRLQGTSFASPQFARSLVDRTPTKAPPAIDPGRWGAAVVDP